MARWVLLRHGESTANAAGFLAGWEDVPLTARGEEQALAAGRQLAHVDLHRVISSDLARARRTAELVLVAREGEVRVAEDPALRERHLGAWAGLPLAELRADGRVQTLLGWGSRPPGGESHADMAMRVLPALARWELEDVASTLIVAHGGLIRTLVGLLDAVPREEIGEIRIPNAVPLVRDLPAGGWSQLAAQLASSLAPARSEHP